MVTIDQIKSLRDKTGISVMLCRKALEEAGGDEGKALILLKKKGAETALKKADRVLLAGTIAAYIHTGGRVGAMVELAAETDFVANHPDFKALAYDLAMHVAASNPEFISLADVPPTAKEEARAAFQREVADKNPALREKIISGKIESFFSERVLYSQPFIKNPSENIKDILDSAIQKFGEKIAVTRFSRFELGR
jgi:elongation factor Ts